MKKIVLRNLPPEIQRAIKRKALNEDTSRADAVIAMVRESELQRMIKRDCDLVAAQLDREESF